LRDFLSRFEAHYRFWRLDGGFWMNPSDLINSLRVDGQRSQKFYA
jgi:hypothetical protein